MRRLLLLGLLGLAVVAFVAHHRAARPPHARVHAALAFPRSGAAGLALRAERAFPALTFRRPLFLAAAPGDDGSVFVVEQDGTIVRVTRAGEAETFLDIAARVSRSDMEEGLLGLAFDPAFATTRAFYVYYSAASPRRSVLSRFHVPEGSTEADPGSEEVLLEIREPYGNHNGGMLAFGPDGFLYVGVGDGGAGGDPHGNGQKLWTLLGKILRIDPSGGKPYAVPKDNPFAQSGIAQPEIWAYGLRNPWRFSFGPDGRLWAGDVGESDREEIDVIVKGGNYGWNVFEGSERYGGWKNALKSTDGMIPPLFEYRHQSAASVTGGYVYRGRALPAYRGAYFFGDFVTGQVWALFEGKDGPEVREVAFVPNLSSFGEDAQGELYALSLGGAIYRFRESEGEPEAPARLSETGLFTDTQGLVPAPGLLPYELRHPGWNDGATARRWIALPAEGRIHADGSGRWTFPPGTAFVMHLESGGRRRETRVLFRDDDGWAAYSYRWNEDGSDAVRGTERKETEDWTYPSTTDCFACHNEPAGRVLGFRAEELGHAVPALKARGVLAPDVPEATDPLPERDGRAPLEARVRAYLDVNCACCHRQGGFTPSAMDLRFRTKLDAMGILDVPPRKPPEGGLPDRIVAPGSPEGSQLWRRLHADAPNRMPPHTRAADPLADELLKPWIESLGR